MKQQYVLLIYTIFLLVPGYSQANDKCRTVHYKDGHFYTINASKQLGVHIRMPSVIATDPVTSNTELWDSDGSGTHVFIKPNSDLPEGASGTLTIIDNNNDSYNFVVKRVKSNPDVCVIVTKSGMFFNKPEKLSQLGMSATHKPAAVNPTAMKVGQSKQQATIDAAIESYATKIFTGYDWDDHAVADTFDDGRFTHIRLNKTPTGVMSILGVINDQEEVVDFQFNDITNTYRVAGIYPALKLRYGSQEITISRDDY